MWEKKQPTLPSFLSKYICEELQSPAVLDQKHFLLSKGKCSSIPRVIPTLHHLTSHPGWAYRRCQVQNLGCSSWSLSVILQHCLLPACSHHIPIATQTQTQQEPYFIALTFCPWSPAEGSVIEQNWPPPHYTPRARTRSVWYGEHSSCGMEGH